MTDALKKYLAADHYYASIGTYLAMNPLITKKSLNITSPLAILADLDECAFEELSLYISNLPSKNITKTSVPQFNYIASGSYGMLKLLLSNGDYGMSYMDIGRHAVEPVKDTKHAIEKYGQLHAGLAYELDLVYMVSHNREKHVYISELGYALMKFNEQEQRLLCAKLILAVPIISYLLKQAAAGDVILEDILGQFVTGQTISRRAYTVNKLLDEVRTCAGCNLTLLDRIKN